MSTAAPRQAASVKVLNPQLRVPLSFIIDDSTCLVNMGHYCMPQFATAWPARDNYKKPWQTWPREIPDSFVREFGQWCADQGVKGKYSVVPYPACVGWLDRELPGWSRKQLQASLKLVRDLMVPNWDIHPEMITHTRVIDLKTGRPLPEISPATMENSYPRTKKSVDELAAYLAYALRILKNCDLPCEGVTTPGGFGNLVKSELSLAVHEAVRDVYGSELPHYFKYVVNGDESAQPKLEHVRDLDSSDPKVTVNVPACTGDWFGGWDGDRQSEGDRYANHDATSGRMVELIKRGEPAVMLCHWPGMYTQGTKQGFAAFKKVVKALAARYGNQTIWMKISEIGRYWTAKELTRIEHGNRKISFQAPFGTPRFTVRVPVPATAAPKLTIQQRPIPLEPVSQARLLKTGNWLADPQGMVVCFDLPRGSSQLSW
ncbi:MAG TPA: hypothetical protein EYN03_10055 [Planctomycetes bacterium]|nr:hypothetical protein [Planctomycetaceae bacterium]HIN95974.1 hypothetical protein [Planctomycetota bacterium]